MLRDSAPGEVELRRSVIPPDVSPEELLNLFKREGLYYARVKYSAGSEPLEIALHGISSEEQARAAVEVLTSFAPGETIR